MGKLIELWENPYCNGEIFKKKKIELNTGLTILVGCNGAGKSTLLHNIKCVIEKEIESNEQEEHIMLINFNNLADGGSRAKESFGFTGRFDLLSQAMSSSEGEEIMLNICQLARKIGYKAKTISKEKEFFVLLDACDSGLSVDNVIDLKKDLFNTIIKDFNVTKKDVDLYIIVASNEYELARNENCFDVINGEYVRFSNYEDYRRFILETKKEKTNQKR